KKPHTKMSQSMLEQRKHEAYSQLGKKDGEARDEQLAREGYRTAEQPHKEYDNGVIDEELDEKKAKEDEDDYRNHTYPMHKKSA
ncbi:MAG: hypothetical protein ACTHJ4_06825, partial [Candidatus Nucleicultricaceae bacterium]